MVYVYIFTYTLQYVCNILHTYLFKILLLQIQVAKCIVINFKGNMIEVLTTANKISI